MITGFFQAICRIGIFMVCAQTFVHFRPKETYEKYLRLLVGTMIVLQLFLPLTNLFRGENVQSLTEGFEQFQMKLERDMEDCMREASKADQVLEKMTLEEVRKESIIHIEEVSEIAITGDSVKE